MYKDFPLRYFLFYSREISRWKSIPLFRTRGSVPQIVRTEVGGGKISAIEFEAFWKTAIFNQFWGNLLILFVGVWNVKYDIDLSLEKGSNYFLAPMFGTYVCFLFWSTMLASAECFSYPLLLLAPNKLLR